MMMRYHFDLRDEAGVMIDEQGMKLSNLQRVQEEAARSLADMVQEAVGAAVHCAIVLRGDIRSLSV
jgi:hypothetical protein